MESMIVRRQDDDGVCGDKKSVAIDALVLTIQGNRRMKILRLKAVMGMTGLARSTIYKYMSAGQFPKQTKLGLRCVGWLCAEVEAWITERLEAR